MQMLKYFIVSFALLSLILSGCGSKSPEPQVIEEKEEVEVSPEAEEKTEVEVDKDDEEILDLVHVKKIEEEERKQEEIAAEFLAQEAALKAAEAKAAAEAEAQEKLLAQTEQQTAETTQAEASATDAGSAEIVQPTTKEVSTELSQEILTSATQEVNAESSSDDSQKVAQDNTKETAQELIPEASSTEPELSADTTTANIQETVTAAVTVSSADTIPADESQVTQVDKPAAVAVIVAPEQDDSPPMFMPISRLALVSALKLVACKNVPAKMEDVHQRLLKTKDLNIADRSLRDDNNDRLMPVIHFDFDQITIKSDYQKLIRQQSACVMKALEARGDMIVQIEGHADERGSDEYNLALGHRRANAIANSIMAYLPNSKLARILSYGEEFPLDSNSGKSAWDKNRRVEFTLLLKP